MNDSFYRAFEDRHRGPRELIKERLGAYQPFLAPLRVLAQAPAALDLGCGRGEWLELLAEQGFSASGVDLDEGMLAACRERGLAVTNADALADLRARPGASLDLVSAFHLVEHIPFDQVQELVTQALRVLRPGGLLIMETPNPENLVVATSGFYMDPSHLRPLPPPLLDFVVEHAGFARHKVLRLQEPPQLHDAAHLELINVLNGVSPDFAVVAQKAGGLPQAFDGAFAAELGLDLGTLARRYQAQQDNVHGELDVRVDAVERDTAGVYKHALDTLGTVQSMTHQVQVELRAALQREQALQAALQAQTLAERDARLLASEQRAVYAAQRAEQAEQRAEQAERRAEQRTLQAAQHAEQAEQRAAQRAQQAEQRAHQAEQRAQQAEQRAEQAEQRAGQAEQHIEAVYASSSWRITRPARAALSLLKRPPRPADSAPAEARQQARGPGLVHKLVRKLVRHDRARALAIRLVARFPKLDARLRALAYRSLQQGAQAGPAGEAPAHQQSPLSEPAQRIYAQLQRQADQGVTDPNDH
jgi:O-antigen chain-terminating methyltransferase